jgi:tRNA dimethylallyltransferase
MTDSPTTFRRSPFISHDFLRAQRPLVVLTGPTAVGKSQVAVLLAKTLGTGVITADSRQVYRGMDIGTDKPSLQERQGVPHRLIDLVDPDQPFNVGEYRRYALDEAERLYREGRVPLVVGGTGLYVRALVHGLWEGPTADWNFRARMSGMARRLGTSYLHEQLARVDPELARRLHPNDEVKIIRGLEVHHLSGGALSDAHRRHGFREASFSALLIGLARGREALYRRIEERVGSQLTKGLVEETRRLLEKGYGRHLGSMKGLGYRQIAGYVAGEYSYEEAVRRLKRDTRRFAKRQLTWFRKEPGITWLSIEEHESTEQVASRAMERIGRFLSELADDLQLSPNVRSL